MKSSDAAKLKFGQRVTDGRRRGIIVRERDSCFCVEILWEDMYTSITPQYDFRHIRKGWPRKKRK